jgi:hypothetical protein
MAHYAFLNENNIVTEVIVGVDENIFQIDFNENTVGGSSDSWEDWYKNFRNQDCKRTSYNGNFRKNYAGIGYYYDSIRDAFIPPKPFPSWILNEQTCLWESPIPYPNDGNTYQWNEETSNWIQLN